MIDLRPHFQKLERIEPLRIHGRVNRAGGLVIESDGPRVSIGEVCEIWPDEQSETVEAEVIGFRGKTVLSMPLYSTDGVCLGDRVVSLKKQPSIAVSEKLLGRVVDATGRPLDGSGLPHRSESRSLLEAPVNPLKRPPISHSLGTGVRCIDGLLPVGRGQRIGIFGGSGVGKSTLLGMMAKFTEATVNVIALVGERGREVNPFVEQQLGPEGLERSVVVVSTSDHPPLMRIRAALAATTIAEFFRDRGHHVLLVMDSVTRVAMAQREVGLAAGEPPSSKGYTPSVFALLPKLFERAGNFEKGSITGFYTVLMEGDDLQEPVADAVRGLLDGHIVLSRELAAHNHFPAIDVLESVSRLSNDLMEVPHAEAAHEMRRLLAAYRKAEDMINIGAYSKGGNATLDRAVEMIERIQLFLTQKRDQEVARSAAVEELVGLCRK